MTEMTGPTTASESAAARADETAQTIELDLLSLMAAAIAAAISLADLAALKLAVPLAAVMAVSGPVIAGCMVIVRPGGRGA